MFYYQNLNDNIPKRYWFHSRCYFNKMHIEWVSPNFNIFGFKIGIADGESDVLSFSFNFCIFSIYFSWENYKLNNWLQKITKRKKDKYGSGRQVGLSIHDGIIWFDLWKDPNCWSSQDPKWWSFSFNFKDLILGKPSFSEKIIESKDVEIPMPEKSYKAKANISVCTWERSRWFSKKIKMVTFDMQEPIPFRGKGTDSYNCGKDSIHDFTVKGGSIAESVGRLVGTVLNKRVKNGGWTDWKFMW